MVRITDNDLIISGNVFKDNIVSSLSGLGNSSNGGFGNEGLNLYEWLKDKISKMTTIVGITSAVSNSTLTLADTGLSILLPANKKYKFEAYIPFTAAAPSTGMALSITSPLNYYWTSVIDPGLVAQTASSGSFGGFYNTAGTIISPGSRTGSMGYLTGFILVGSTGGEFKIQFASEVATSSVTIDVNSKLILEEIF